MEKRAYLDWAQIEALKVQEAASDKAQKRTPEQIEAIYSHGQNILVSASAGSGKTFVMVERIVDMLSRGVGVRELFISTFTVKAANELKDRLEKKLREAIPKADSDEQRQHLSQQLADVQLADIGTMDAFTQKLVKEYGYLLGISSQFRILQAESEILLLKNEVFDDLFEDYMKNDEDHRFEQLVKNFSGKRKDIKGFREVIYQLYDFLSSTSSPKVWLENNFFPQAQTDFFKGLLADFREVLFKTANQLEDLTELPDYARVTQKGKETADFQKMKGYIALLREFDQHFDDFFSQENLAMSLKQLTETLPSGNEKTVKGVKYPVYQQFHQSKGALTQQLFIREHEEGAEMILEDLRQFVTDFEEQFFQRKKQENSFQFSDISHLAIELLSTSDEVREQYQHRYEEVMVDEYQDTNHTQEAMLELLSKGDNRFMVGDIKQSIYRFRQADPSIFSEKFHRYQTDSQAGQLILLKENFRSRVEVLATTNALFSRLMDEQIGELIYDNTHQLVAGNEKTQVARKDKDTADLTSQFLIYDTSEESELTFSGQALVTAKEILRLHREEKVKFSDMTLLVSSRSRYADVMEAFDYYGIPLVTDGGKPNYLQSVDVMVMLDTLRAINNPLNDYALVALLKSPMFAFNEDELTKISLQADKMPFYQKLTRSYWLKLDDDSKPSWVENWLNESLAEVGKKPEISHSELLDDRFVKKIGSFLDYFTSWRTYAKTHRLYDLIWKIYKDRLYYDYVGLLSKGEQRQVNLYALALRAHQFEETGFKGLPRFIRMIDKILQNDKDLDNVELPKPTDAVTMMTIHKSKGLEFPYVFILNMDKEFNDIEERSQLIISRDSGVGIKYLTDIRQEFEKGDVPLPPQVLVSLPTTAFQTNKKALHRANLSEQMRLLYVAMTRAEKKLYLVGSGSREKLEDAFEGTLENNRLPLNQRETVKTFQDWLLAVTASYKSQPFPMTVTYYSPEELIGDGLEPVQPKVIKDDQKDNRQSPAIKEALEVLENVEKLNRVYRPTIDLPTLRTPSQIKKRYEGIIDDDANEGRELRKRPLEFDRPNLAQTVQITPAAVGSVVHEVMQRLDLSTPPTMASFEQALKETDAPDEVKAAVALDKLLAFFDTDLGKTILAHVDCLVREAPFAMLERAALIDQDFRASLQKLSEDNEVSKTILETISDEEVVIRGIIDGYLEFDDRVILFDYKTDRYVKKEHLIQRYQAQMDLYARVLHRSTHKPVEKQLILLGGEQVQVVEIGKDE